MGYPVSLMAHEGQLRLFEDDLAPSDSVEPAPVPQEARETASRLPQGIRLGTSSWAFPSWKGIVYSAGSSDKLLSREGLRAYSQHPLLGAAGIDRSYYAPLAPEELSAYGEQTPSGFLFLIKAHEMCTVDRFPPHRRYGKRADSVNPLFLDPVYAAEQVVQPLVRGLAPGRGVLLFQFSPMDLDRLGSPRDFARRLGDFLQALAPGPPLAVELRNRSLLTPDYFAALRSSGAVHCLNIHSAMPSLDEQLRRMGDPEGDIAVVRWMLQAPLSYEQARDRYRPYDRLIDPDPESRRRIARFSREVAAAGKTALVIANNKAEGCAPRSLWKLADLIADG